MKALSLFSGIGGIDLAAEWVGIETVAFCEREPFCQKVLAKHWPNIPIYDDVCTLTKERLEADGIGTIELIHGGYPCQPFSTAGERKGENDDRHLWPEVLRLIKSIRPRWFVGENVAGHITLGLDGVLSDLGNIGYTCQAFVIPASAVYAQHRRDRVFIVANSASKGLEGPTRSKLFRQSNGSSVCSENVADSKCFGQSGSREFIKSINSTENEDGETTRTINGGVGDQWAIEPPVGRVANGIPQRVDRLKALGNAVVPQQIYPILAAIVAVEKDEVKSV